MSALLSAIGEFWPCTRVDAAIATSFATHFIVRADTAADNGADSEASLYSKVGDSHDSMDEAVGVADDDAFAASGRAQRQTSHYTRPL